MSEITRAPDQVRVLIIDDEELVRCGMRGVLAAEGRFTVVGEIARPGDVAQACQDLSPDIVFLGIERHSDNRTALRDGLAALRQALRVYPAAHVIILMDGKTPDDLVEVLRAGARGALVRGASAASLLKAVDDVLEGDVALDPRLARGLSEYLTHQGGQFMSLDFNTDPRFDARALTALSPRERDVFGALLRGCRNEEISAELGVTLGTVKTHLRHIYHKLGVTNRTAAILVALRTRLPEVA